MTGLIAITALVPDDGRMHFKVTVTQQLASGGFTGVFDQVTEQGVAPGLISYED
jgi:hypothetical protein